MRVEFQACEPCANTFDILATQAMYQVRLAHNADELAKAAQFNLKLADSASIKVSQHYRLVKNEIDTVELWQVDDKGQPTKKLLKAWLAMANRPNETLNGLLVRKAALYA